MRSSVSKWGNSLAVRVPKQAADRAGLKEGAAVQVTAERGRLVIVAARPRYELTDLLKKERKTTQHPEVDWGPPRGKEIW